MLKKIQLYILLPIFFSASAFGMNHSGKFSSINFYWLLKQLNLPVEIVNEIVSLGINAESDTLTHLLDGKFAPVNVTLIAEIVNKYACEYRSPLKEYSLLNVLKKNGKNLFFKDMVLKNTILHISCAHSYEDGVELLLDSARADGVLKPLLLDQNVHFFTPLILGSANGMTTRSIELLLCSAQQCRILNKYLSMTDSQGKFAAHFLKEKGHEDGLKLIEKFSLIADKNEEKPFYNGYLIIKVKAKGLSLKNIKPEGWDGKLPIIWAGDPSKLHLSNFDVWVIDPSQLHEDCEQIIWYGLVTNESNRWRWLRHHKKEIVEDYISRNN